METFLLLATEAHAVGSELAETAGEGGFGLNLDILETNLINLLILIGVLFYFGRKLIANILTERRARIEAAIVEAEQRQREAAAALADAQQKLTQSQAEAQRIRQEAETSAKKAKEALLAKAAEDVQRMQETAVQELNTERERAIAELRQRVATMALQRVESQLRGQLDEAAQQQLINRSIASIGGR